MKKKEKDNPKQPEEAINPAIETPITPAPETAITPAVETTITPAPETAEPTETSNPSDQNPQNESSNLRDQCDLCDQQPPSESSNLRDQCDLCDQQPQNPPIRDYSYAVEGLAEAEQEAVKQWLTTLTDEIDRHALSRESIEAVLHAIHYDRDIAQAGIDGEVRGRNTKIEDLFEKKKQAADIHILHGSHWHETDMPPASLIGGLSAADRQTIWEKGNEKRVVLR